MRLWGCALVAGLLIAVIAGIAALAGAFSTHTASAAPTGAAGQADDAICFQFTYGVPNAISQAQQRAASPELATLVAQWSADSELGSNAEDSHAIIVWCNNHGLEVGLRVPRPEAVRGAPG